MPGVGFDRRLVRMFPVRMRGFRTDKNSPIDPHAPPEMRLTTGNTPWSAARICPIAVLTVKGRNVIGPLDGTPELKVECVPVVSDTSLFRPLVPADLNQPCGTTSAITQTRQLRIGDWCTLSGLPNYEIAEESEFCWVGIGALVKRCHRCPSVGISAESRSLVRRKCRSSPISALGCRLIFP